MHETVDWMVAQASLVLVLYEFSSIIPVKSTQEPSWAANTCSHTDTHTNTSLYYIYEMSHKSHSAVSLQAAKPKCLGHVINAVKMEMDADGWQSCLRGTPA